MRRLAGTAIMGLLLAGAAACGESAGEAAAGEVPTPVGVWTMKASEVSVERRWAGRLEPLRTIPVRAPGAGRVAAVEVGDGVRVRAGDVLLRLEGPDVQARRAVLQERKSYLEEELARWRRLADGGAAGPGEVTAAALRVLEVREQLEELDATVEAYVVRAPATGTVQSTAVSPGTNVGGGEILLEVDDAAAQGVRLSVASTETLLLENRDRLSVRDDRGNEFEVDRIVFSSDPHPAFVTADLYLRGDVVGDRRGVVVTHRTGGGDVLLVPWTAVASDEDRHWVAVVAPGDPERIERRTVELGRGHSEGIEVLAGLAEGDRVIRYDPRAHPEGRAVVVLRGGGTEDR
jgi:RND family efflux transporter MFP subunit